MKKIITVPDLHGNVYRAKKIAEKVGDCDLMVFMGDYVDSSEYSRAEQAACVEFLIDLRQKHNNVVLLLGNHDYRYVKQVEMPGWPMEYKEYIGLFNDISRNRELFQVGHCIEVSTGRWWLFTHAGLNAKFVRQFKALDSIHPSKIIHALNLGWWHGEAAAFYGKPMIRLNADCKHDAIDEYIVKSMYVRAMFDVHPLRAGNANHGGVLWADKKEMLAPKAFLQNVSQFMGHTCTYSNKAMYEHDGKVVQRQKIPYDYSGHFHFFCGESTLNEHILR